MIGSIILHECKQRGLTLSVVDGRVSVSAAADARDPAFERLIGQHEAEIIAVLPAPSPHCHAPSPPLVHIENEGGLGEPEPETPYNSTTYNNKLNSIQRDSPHSPRYSRIDTHSGGNFLSDASGGDSGNLFPSVGGAISAPKGGLSGLSERNSLHDESLSAVHPTETSGLVVDYSPQCGLGAPWRGEDRRKLAGWDISWREAWGHRSNALENLGLPCGEAESQAFAEVQTALKAGGDPAQFLPAIEAEVLDLVAAPDVPPPSLPSIAVAIPVIAAPQRVARKASRQERGLFASMTTEDQPR